MTVARLEDLVSLFLVVVVVGLLVWLLIEVIRNPRPKDQRDDRTVSRGEWRDPNNRSKQ